MVRIIDHVLVTLALTLALTITHTLTFTFIESLLAKSINIQSMKEINQFFDWIDRYNTELLNVVLVYSQTIYENIYKIILQEKKILPNKTPVSPIPSSTQNTNSTNSTNTIIFKNITYVEHLQNTINYFDKLLSLGNFQYFLYFNYYRYLNFLSSAEYKINQKVNENLLVKEVVASNTNNSTTSNSTSANSTAVVKPTLKNDVNVSDIVYNVIANETESYLFNPIYIKNSKNIHSGEKIKLMKFLRRMVNSSETNIRIRGFTIEVNALYYKNEKKLRMLTSNLTENQNNYFNMTECLKHVKSMSLNEFPIRIFAIEYKNFLNFDMNYKYISTNSLSLEIEANKEIKRKLFLCENNKVYYYLKLKNEKYKSNIDKYLTYKDYDLDIFNKTHKFFQSRCFRHKNGSFSEFTLNQRKRYFYQNYTGKCVSHKNISMLNDKCHFQGISKDYYMHCECNVLYEINHVFLPDQIPDFDIINIGIFFCLPQGDIKVCK